MTATKAKKPKPRAKPPAKGLTIDDAKPAKMTPICGGSSDDFNEVQAAAVVNALPYGADWTEDQKNIVRLAAVSGMRDMKPRDVIDGMLAGMIVGMNNATLDCLRRAQINSQTFEARQMNLSAANKLAGSMARMIEIFDRRRGNGSMQRVTVEHVHVHAGGQAVVGAVEAGGGRGQLQIEGQSHAQEAVPTVAALRGKDAGRDSLPVAGGQRPVAMPDARRDKSRRATRSG